jgi:glutamyl-Q tRNA(Asp) synthetase
MIERTHYVGRFAPSPTGPLHLGSLTTAVASYLEARRHHGRWLLRIEDLDTPRVRPGSCLAMIQTLESLGFEWDGPIVYQSQRDDAYRKAMERLAGLGLTYPCGCSRKQRVESEHEFRYAGSCRNGTSAPGPWALRFRADDGLELSIVDGLRGRQSWHWSSLGDPILVRRDNIVAYQLAVVVDDATAGVTDIVRGEDLLASTPWQLALQAALGVDQPRYLHLPLVTNADGSKLSKSRHAVGVGPTAAVSSGHWLFRALSLLRQAPPEALRDVALDEIWAWATTHWALNKLEDVAALPQDKHSY